MADIDPHDLNSVLTQIHNQAAAEALRVTQHAQQEMVEEEISLDEVLQTLVNGSILENYPTHQCGACCLVGGQCHNGRNLHVVCTTTQPILIIITVYEPKPPKWVTPSERRTG